MAGYALDKMTGLTQLEVRERQERDGFNELPSQGRRGVLDIFFGVLKEPMFLLLIEGSGDADNDKHEPQQHHRFPNFP